MKDFSKELFDFERIAEIVKNYNLDSAEVEIGGSKFRIKRDSKAFRADIEDEVSNVLRDQKKMVTAINKGLDIDQQKQKVDYNA